MTSFRRITNKQRNLCLVGSRKVLVRGSMCVGREQDDWACSQLWPVCFERCFTR